MREVDMKVKSVRTSPNRKMILVYRPPLWAAAGALTNDVPRGSQADMLTEARKNMRTFNIQIRNFLQRAFICRLGKTLSSGFSVAIFALSGIAWQEGVAAEQKKSVASHAATDPSNAVANSSVFSTAAEIDATSSNPAASPKSGKESQGVLVFYLDEHFAPIVRLNRLARTSEGIHAILAMYALQNGGGCAGRSEQGVQCLLTSELGLGAQCSPEHILQIRKWFVQGIPQMSGFSKALYERPQAPGTLEAICYGQPDTATWQRVWTSIRVKDDGDMVRVSASGRWRTSDASETFQFQTIFRVRDDGIATISHRVSNGRIGSR